MSQKLFHRIQPWEGNVAEKTSNEVIEDLIGKCTNRFQDMRINKINTICLSKELIFKNTNNFNQAYIPQPLAQLIREEIQTIDSTYVKNRPFSAKINKFYVQKSPSKKFRQRSRSKNSIIYKESFKNSILIKKQANFIDKPVLKTFFQLETDKSQDDFESESYINLLRKKKASEEVQNDLKQRFIKTSAFENDLYPKINKKFIQTMGSKNFYYNKNGQVAQIHKSRTNLLKKTQKQRLKLVVTENTKRKTEKTKRLILVEFQGKQNGSMKTREEVQLLDNNAQLFYTSSNCTYQIIQQRNHQA